MSGPYFEFFCPVKIVAGSLALEHMPYELGQRGSNKPLIVTDQGVRAAKLVDVVQAALTSGGVSAELVFDDIPQDSSTTAVTAIARFYRDNRCDSLIAIGGGSVIDTAKAVNILVSEGGDDLHRYAGTNVLKKPLKPLFVLPTTSGTGSEVTNVSVIKDAQSGLKLAFVSGYILPDVAVLDPRMTLGLPPFFTAATAMDALTHATEAFTCLGKNPISDAYATAAIKKVANNVLQVLETPTDQERRLELSVAATMAGIAFSNSMVGLVHALGHTIGAITHLPHGVCMSVLLPYVLEYNLPARADVIGELLIPLAGAETYAKIPAQDRGRAAIAKIRVLRDQLWAKAKLPRTLSETGRVHRDQLPDIARHSLNDGALIMNPVDVRYEDALRVLERAF
ncbi:MAG TPA: iron-containing alcohol dehydrogenase [Polyangiales bacterium]|nr:iron-containing alcohol dehydrogenase [Polyangiales bacterium]